MKMKAMLSQPMNGKTEEEIVATRERAIAALESKGYDCSRMNGTAPQNARNAVSSISR